MRLTESDIESLYLAISGDQETMYLANRIQESGHNFNPSSLQSLDTASSLECKIPVTSILLRPQVPITLKILIIHGCSELPFWSC